MLFILFTTLFTLLQPCSGSPTFQEEYRGSYTPAFIETDYGPQVVAPDTPYVAAAGQKQLYFIDTRFSPESAKHVKEQIEAAFVPRPKEYIFIDEILVTAERRDAATGETTFVFDPVYARVFFAKGINKRNPGLQLPVHEPAGDWLVTYDLNNTLATKRANSCSRYGCESESDCLRQSHGLCSFCHNYRVDNECETGIVNAVGICSFMGCTPPAIVSREAGETDTSYYQRMDKLHWG